MKINWKLRLQNKVTLMAITGGLVALVYQVLGLFGITTQISSSEVIKTGAMIINLLVLAGVVTDPTTKGIGDSARALGKEEL